ncbi:hypothetical protein [Paraglaciecola aestuariivivens]
MTLSQHKPSMLCLSLIQSANINNVMKQLLAVYLPEQAELSYDEIVSI